MLEVRFHGRGGQGAVTSAELLAIAAIEEGKFAQAFPSFGPERRGAPVMAFSRVSDSRIRTRCQIYEPDVVIVLDSSILNVVNVCDGLKDGGLVVVNSPKAFKEVKEIIGVPCRLAVVDATHIARECLGRPITNTTMLGAAIKATGVVDLDSMTGPLDKRFGKIAAKNFNAMKRAFDEVKIKEVTK